MDTFRVSMPVFVCLVSFSSVLIRVNLWSKLYGRETCHPLHAGQRTALAQANLIASMCRATFPGLRFEPKIVKTTGDRLQTASLAKTDPSLPKGLFNKELEIALAEGEADMEVHNLKDLPTELPAGLILGGTPAREDVRGV